MKLIIIVLVLFSNSIYSQLISADSVNVNGNLEMIENQIKRNKILKHFRCRKEDKFSKNILDENFASTYAQEIFKNQNPRISLEKTKHSVAVREDSTKKLWIVMIIFPNAMDGLFAYIFSKNDGELIFYGNHWHS
jgi:hypothetical protein